MVNYPAQIDTTTSLPTVIDNITPIDAAVVNRLRDTILQIETELGVKPSTIYTTVRNRLDTIEGSISGIGTIIPAFGGDLSGDLLSQTVVGLFNRPLNTSIIPLDGYSLIWDGYAWTPSANFRAQNISTIGKITGGPSLFTSASTGLLTINGKTVYGGVSGAGLSGSGQAVMYYDSIQNKLLISENGGSFTTLTGIPIDGYFGNINIHTTGSLTCGQILSTSETTGLINLHGKLVVNGITTSAVSGVGQGVIYFDSITNKFMISENGSSYTSIGSVSDGYFGSSNITTTGYLQAGQTFLSSLDTGLATIDGKIIVNGISTSTLSNPGQAIFYFDSITNKLKLSEDGGIYKNVIDDIVATTITATSYTATNDDHFIGVISGGNITLPSSPSTGKILVIKDINGISSGSNILILGNTNTIDNQVSFTLNTDFQTITIIYNGAQWSLI